MVANRQIITSKTTGLEPIKPTVRTKRALQKQHVIASNYAFDRGLRALSNNIDDVTRVRGNRVYEEMLHDPDVSSAYWYLVYAILADDLEIRPNITKQDSEDYARSNRNAMFCQDSINGLDIPIRDILEDMLDGMITGHKISELTFKVTEWLDPLTNKSSSYLMLDSITVLPHTAAAFVVDDFNKVRGIVGRRTGEVLTFGMPLQDRQRLIEREKFFCLSFRTHNGNPVGRSLFRSAFNAWNFKTQVWPEFLRYIMTQAMPSLIGFTPEDAYSPTNQFGSATSDSEGNALQDEYGNPAEESPEQNTTNILAAIRNGSVGTLPGGSKVEEIFGRGKADVFETTFGITGAEISKGILLQELATREGRHQTRASTSSMMTIVDILIWSLKNIVVRAFRRDVIKLHILMNFGQEDVDRFLPITALGDTERRDWALDATAASQILPFCTHSQAEAIKSQLGVPPSEAGDKEFIGRMGKTKVSNSEERAARREKAEEDGVIE